VRLFIAISSSFIISHPLSREEEVEEEGCTPAEREMRSFRNDGVVIEKWTTLGWGGRGEIIFRFCDNANTIIIITKSVRVHLLINNI
jgi:hypothetical protein